jgi:signal transduction histidine kinase
MSDRIRALLFARQLKERALLIAVVITTIVIVGFGVAQYRWSRQVSDAAAVRLADTLQMSMVNWQVDLLRTFSDVTASMDSPRYPRLVKTITPVTGARKGDSSEWQFDPDTPALISGSHVIELDLAVLRTQLLPDLAHRYFQGTDGLDYEVTLVAKGASRTVLYTSDPGFGDRPVEDADGTLQVFGSADGRPIRVFSQTSREKDQYVAAMTWLPLIPSAEGSQAWELVVRHRRGGPLGAFLRETRRRDMAIGAGALVLLVASIALLVVTSTRAQRLARLQMDFVTAVSHELRTPLTVIRSAADNIAHGVVEERQSMQEYGTVIGAQVSQLSRLVEQILLFASHRRNPQRLTMKRLEVIDIIDATLASTEGLIRAADFTIDRTIEPNLPPVMGDLVALSQCLQNLVTNALKYGRERRWLAIHAQLATDGAQREVRISVEDRGIGISRSERNRIFEPFYRSPSASAAQVHGTGLGLALAATIAEMMGGRLTVASEPGQGSTFTLHLPTADAAESPGFEQAFEPQ